METQNKKQELENRCNLILFKLTIYQVNSQVILTDLFITYLLEENMLNKAEKYIIMAEQLFPSIPK